MWASNIRVWLHVGVCGVLMIHTGADLYKGFQNKTTVNTMQDFFSLF